MWTDYPPATLRQVVRGWIEEKSGQGLSVSDPLPDELIWVMQSKRSNPAALKAWIYSCEAGRGAEFALWLDSLRELQESGDPALSNAVELLLAGFGGRC